MITGGSSGIGAAFARQFAARGLRLLLVARGAERLQSLAADLQRRYGVVVDVLAVDLADPAAVTAVEAYMTTIHRLAVLVNNAGFGTSALFADADPATQIALIQVHVLASVRLTRAALPGMLIRRQGAIINVSSVGAWMPAPRNATYAATKSFLKVFSQALHAEVRGSGVRVQALCPGFTATGFHDTAEYARFDRRSVPGWMWMTADDVVTGSLRG